MAANYAGKVEIHAGVRNPEKADKLKAVAGVSVAQAVMGSGELSNTLKGVHALLIVTPSTENRVELVYSSAKSALEAGVKHIVAVSGTMAGIQYSFGRQFNQVETAVKELGVHYTILRLPWFFENAFGFKDTIKSAGALFLPVDPTKKLM